MTLKEQFSEYVTYNSWDKENFNAIECEKIADDYAIEFYNWMRENDCPENDELFFGYTDKDMLNFFKKIKGL